MPANTGSKTTPSTVRSTGAELEGLCRETGWRFVERSEGKLAVDLGVPNAFHQAILEEGTGAVRVYVDFSTDGPLPGACRRALGVFLLAACGIVKMARAAADEMDGRTAVWFEVVFAACPSAAELVHALSALSVACRFFGQEVRVLQQDERMAEEYLAIQGWSW